MEFNCLFINWRAHFLFSSSSSQAPIYLSTLLSLLISLENFWCGGRNNNYSNNGVERESVM